MPFFLPLSTPELGEAREGFRGRRKLSPGAAPNSPEFLLLLLALVVGVVLVLVLVVVVGIS